MTSDQMKPILLDLVKVPSGHYDCRRARWHQRVFDDLRGKRGGWVHVTRNTEDGCSFMWTTERDTHFSLQPAMSITLFNDGQLKFFMETALTWWVKWSYWKPNERLDELDRANSFAVWLHEKLCSRS